MTATIIGITTKQESNWTIQWGNKSVMTKIHNKSLHIQVMKCDKEMSEHLFNAQRRFDLLHPKGEGKN